MRQVTEVARAHGAGPPARVVLAHGASGTALQMAPHVAGLLARGFDAHAIDLPKRRAELAVPVWREALAALPAAPGARVAIGGQSYGGRVASLLLADDPGAADALVLFSYPLHAPGKPDGWEARAAHLPRVRVPALFLSGEADPLARLDLLRAAVRLLPDATLRTWPGLAHSLTPVLDGALDVLAAWLAQRLR